MITMIVACDDNLGMSRDGKIPWSVREDMQHFKRTTLGDGNNAIIMGRKTFESIGKKALKGRRNIVLTRDASYGKSFDLTERVKFSYSKDDALDSAKHFDEIFIIGGNEIYDLFYDVADRFLISRIHGDFSCDQRLGFITNPFYADGFVETKHEEFDEFDLYEVKRSI